MKQHELLRMLAAAVVRHGLTMLSTYLVAQHMLAPEHSADFVANVTNYAVDAIPGLVALIWSAVQKSDSHDEIKQGAAISGIVAPPAPPSVIVVTTPPAPADVPAPKE